ncbi:adenosylmethionine--8-amino-7-oxononanoate transaminase [Veillonella sp.]|uniref:adenosylmethionine--8-amino-7-oxononanoate transaminase n=1 Tax=Veillonella sp. TaxID=1926307 RepID=UPI0025D32802|nr:adenosylmethionine--8-amino-7-oxononanoate transaminase [Veillonella sp.]
MKSQVWVEKDLAHIWHPCSQMKDYETLPPIVIDHGKGAYLYDVDGKEYIDIISSWWCNLLGHCNPKINEAIKQQLDTLEHVIFANLSHKPAITLAEKLVEILPKGLNKLHFNDNGSGAVECALKVAFQYQYQTGHPERQKFMCLSESYHGETMGALAVGSMDLFAKMYQSMLMETIHTEAPDCYRCPYNKTRETCDCECFVHMEENFAKHSHELAAVIVEPIVQGCAGMRIYPPAYLKKLRALCDQYGVLLIADEIATGFGRTGKFFACDHAGITPDIMTISKALTGGYMPMSIMAVTDAIYNAFYADYFEYKAFMHSHTYSGNPLGCAAALATIDILQHDGVMETAQEKAVFLHKALQEALGNHPNVGEIRHIGLINAIELVKDPKTKEPLPGKARTGYAIYKKALDRGLLLRPLGDILYFNPPLTIDNDTLEEAIRRTVASFDDVLG